MEKISLSETIAQLRQELLQAQTEGEGSDLKFLIEDAEIELQLVTTKEVDGGGGVKFWVYSANASVKGAEAKTQKLKFKLKPVGADGKKPILVADDDELPN